MGAGVTRAMEVGHSPWESLRCVPPIPHRACPWLPLARDLKAEAARTRLIPFRFETCTTPVPDIFGPQDKTDGLDGSRQVKLMHDAMRSMHKEMRKMDVRMGVVRHQLWAKQVGRTLKLSAAAGRGSDNDDDDD